MGESSGGSIYGDAQARRRRTLDAAAALLDEGGYSALTIRSVAKRAGTSTGLIYQYFADKQDIFMALLDENIVESTRVVAALPRDRGVTVLIAAIIDEAARRWGRLGRMSQIWRDAEHAADTERESLRAVHDSGRRYDEEVLEAVTEAAAKEGRVLRDDTAVLPFLLSSMQGVAASIVNDWASYLDSDEFAQFSAAALTRAITSTEPVD
ncbi:TetR/AcrR family transcriptional regulator [Prescottella agglutinans]|uniref:TetR/AcrR family transcriptional regulator n=1 Tax=Prescottella agglutinans TaxID=1644129 RepID=A0A3S3AFE3_9NOCA|nr:TetR/AcrR family transcriptional regulator [Prescottella agglutinans]RVW06839.1 TetR/AcrR family transcriptional regulator [Prescottella agglutinans]